MRRAYLELEKARDKYSDLYDSAPAGYFSINDKGTILEANLKSASMLGVERRSLIGKLFSHFVSAETQDAFYFHRNALLEKKTTQTCNLTLIKRDGTKFHAQLESIVVQDTEGQFNRIRTAVSDISTHAEEKRKP